MAELNKKQFNLNNARKSAGVASDFLVAAKTAIAAKQKEIEVACAAKDQPKCTSLTLTLAAAERRKANLPPCQGSCPSSLKKDQAAVQTEIDLWTQQITDAGCSTDSQEACATLERELKAATANAVLAETSAAEAKQAVREQLAWFLDMQQAVQEKVDTALSDLNLKHWEFENNCLPRGTAEATCDHCSPVASSACVMACAALSDPLPASTVAPITVAPIGNQTLAIGNQTLAVLSTPVVPDAAALAITLERAVRMDCLGAVGNGCSDGSYGSTACSTSQSELKLARNLVEVTAADFTRTTVAAITASDGSELMIAKIKFNAANAKAKRAAVYLSSQQKACVVCTHHSAARPPCVLHYDSPN